MVANSGKPSELMPLRVHMGIHCACHGKGAWMDNSKTSSIPRLLSPLSLHALLASCRASRLAFLSRLYLFRATTLRGCIYQRLRLAATFSEHFTDATYAGVDRGAVNVGCVRCACYAHTNQRRRIRCYSFDNAHRRAAFTARRSCITTAFSCIPAAIMNNLMDRTTRAWFARRIHAVLRQAVPETARINTRI